MRRCCFFYINKIHGNDTAYKTDNAQCLHVFYQLEAVTQVFYLPVQYRLLFAFFVAFVQASYHTAQRKEAVGMCQHNEADGREQKRRGIDAYIHLQM